MIVFIEKFQTAPICEKCGSKSNSFRHRPYEDQMPEHIEVQCRRCEFVWAMHTKDQDDEPEPELVTVRAWRLDEKGEPTGEPVTFEATGIEFR